MSYTGRKKFDQLHLMDTDCKTFLPFEQGVKDIF
jgi:hypothetical protein